MIIAAFVKMFSDTCVCFGIMGAFHTVFSFSYQPIYAALLCACGVAVAAALENTSKSRLRWIGFLFPAASILLADGLQNILILIPVAIYAVVVISRGQFDLEYHSFRYNFRNSLILMVGIFLLYSIIAYLEGLAGENSIDTSFTLRYGIVHGISGIFLQRHLRLGAENRAQGNGSQFAAILGGTVTIILGFAAAEPVLRKGAEVAVKLFVSALLAIPMMIYELYTFLVSKMDFESMKEAVAEEAAEATSPSVEPVLQQYVYEALQQPREESGNGWVILVLLIVICTMAWMIFAYRRQEKKAQTSELVGQIEKTEQRKRESRRSNRGRVRHYYREYLRMERKRGLSLKRHMTTGDILDRITPETNKKAASDLRQIYLRARYDEKCEITREQAELAKDALKRSRIS